MMLPTFEAFRGHAHAVAPHECCGLIVRVGSEELYWPCSNVSETPEDDFKILEEDWIEAELSGEVLAICHSHPCGSADPGPADLEAILEHGLTWFILGAGDVLQRVDPSIPELQGRPFVYGWQDCYTLVRDWLKITRDITLPDYPRQADFWETGRSPYLDQFEAFGFEQVYDLMPGDALLIRVGQAQVANHAAIYVGDGYILHHLWNRLSSRDLYDGRLQRNTTHILRYRR